MKITEGVKFDSALQNAEAWKRDASLYTGRRKQIRLNHAKRMEEIAEKIVAPV